MDLEFINCQLCGKDNTKQLVSREPFYYVQCQDCNLIYLNPRPSKNLIDRIYLEDKFGLADPDRERELYFFRFSERLKNIKRFKKNRGKILDIGCSWGYFLKLAKEEGWDTYGIEISLAQARYARDKFNLRIFIGGLKEARFSAQYFDVVTLWHVLEHIPNPLIELLEIKSILKKDGLLAIEVPGFKRLKYDIAKSKKGSFDERLLHLFYYNFTTLSLLLEKTGFQVIQAKGCGDTGILRIAEKFRMNFIKTLVAKYFHCFMGFKKILQILRRIFKIEENIIIYAKIKRD